jgi:hypothetical protein
VLNSKRYPITRNGLTSQWRRDRERAAEIAPRIRTFRFHDNRHTTGTRVLRSSGNFQLDNAQIARRAVI